MKRKILTYPDSVLNIESKPVIKFDESLEDLTQDMIDTMRSQPNAVGLAAIQIGVPVQVLVIEYQGELIELVNPKITKEEGQTTTLEACLSIPGVKGKVQRAKKIEVNYQDINGQSFYREFTGQLAIIVQHEMEHLRGGLYIDNINSSKRAKIMRKYKK